MIAAMQLQHFGWFNIHNGAGLSILKMVYEFLEDAFPLHDEMISLHLKLSIFRL